MPNLISPNQVAFVPGRQIQDNIIVAQEDLHKLKTMKGKKDSMSWKIDLSKAYDRLQWNFIRDVIVEAGLKGSFVDLIKWYVSTVSYKAVLNKEATETFTPGCGIRQGDPLSPYLFVLCMENLSYLINHIVYFGYWKCVKVSREGPPISHIFFADELILFGQSSITQVEMMKDYLDTFCKLSGQQIRFAKYCIFCSCNTNERVAKSISKVCRSPLTKDLGKSLGVHLIHGRVRNRTYGALVEKVQSRLASWKSDTLSLAGRVTLIKAVTSALHVYTIQSAKIPSNLSLNLDKLNRNFLWGHKDTKKTTHLIKWDTTCMPKNRGGLGIMRMKGMNQALSAKGVVCSSTWRGIAFGAKLISKGLKWRVGYGCQILFWLDNWVLLHGKVLTNEQRCMRGMGLDASCPRCLSGVENIEHLLRGCKDSIGVWEDISKGITSSPTFLGNLDAWLTTNLRSNELVNGSITTGGVLCDHSKSWLGGFVLNRGSGSAIEAEFWGLL
ncbi:hypothetical protein Dsin_001328 [Dipteronia sinensis]|uniref:Reverse transcriptase domain-containing protein n=1 Tax=Dipteronia sinensis TaxID=43782 RepID=A0AAE0EIW5_9ROSI|nr:hypothetical protein Dsin_001328 [Dipteronia sinensis]